MDPAIEKRKEKRQPAHAHAPKVDLLRADFIQITLETSSSSRKFATQEFVVNE